MNAPSVSKECQNNIKTRHPPDSINKCYVMHKRAPSQNKSSIIVHINIPLQTLNKLQRMNVCAQRNA